MLSCCSTGERRTFRSVYYHLTRCLDYRHLDEYVARYEEAQRRREGDAVCHVTALLEEAWPYSTDRAADAEPLLHEELLRIERAWATAVKCRKLHAVSKRRDALALADAWSSAANQLFPFPTAMMLLRAVDTRSIHDDDVWRTIRALNRLAQPRMAMDVSAWSIRHEHNSILEKSALAEQSLAVSGGGYVHKEVLFRAVRFATRPRKFPHGDGNRTCACVFSRPLMSPQ